MIYISFLWRESHQSFNPPPCFEMWAVLMRISFHHCLLRLCFLSEPHVVGLRPVTRHPPLFPPRFPVFAKPSICCYGILLKKRKKEEMKKRNTERKAARQLICRLLFPSDWGFEYFWWFFFFPFSLRLFLSYMQKHIFGSTGDVIRYITTQMCDMKKRKQTKLYF